MPPRPSHFESYRDQEDYLSNIGENPGLHREQAEAIRSMTEMKGNLEMTQQLANIYENLFVVTNKWIENLKVGANYVDDMTKNLERMAGSEDRRLKTSRRLTQEASKERLEVRAKAEAEERRHDAQLRIEKLQKGTTAELKRQLEVHKMIDKQRGDLVTFERYEKGQWKADEASLNEVLDVFRKNQRGKELSDRERQILTNVSGRLRSEMTLAGRAEDMPNTGLRGAMDALRRGDLLGAAGQVATIRSERLTTGVERMADRAAMSGRPGAGILAGGLGRLAGVAGTPLLAGLGAYEFYNRILFPQLSQTRSLGQISGGGIREGMGGRLQALRAGLNPFDVMTQGMAMQVQQTIREAGGADMAGAMGDAVSDVINDLGIDFKDAVTDAMFAVREGGMSLDQFRRQMADLDEVAKDTGQSVTDARAAIIGYTQEVTKTAGQAAGAVAPAVAETFARAIGGGEGPLRELKGQRFQEFLSGVQPQLGLMFGGQLQWNVSSAEAQAQFLKQWDTFLDQVRANRKNFPDDETFARWVSFVAQAGGNPLYTAAFGALTVPEISALLKLSAKEGGNYFRNLVQQQTEQRTEDILFNAQSQREGTLQARMNRWLSTGGIIDGKAVPPPEMDRRDARAYGNSLRRQLRAAGVSSSEIQNILAPIQRPMASSDSGVDWEKAVGEVKQLVEISLTPEARGALEYSASQADVLSGRRGPQGVPRFQPYSRRNSQ